MHTALMDAVLLDIPAILQVQRDAVQLVKRAAVSYLCPPFTSHLFRYFATSSNMPVSLPDTQSGVADYILSYRYNSGLFSSYRCPMRRVQLLLPSWRHLLVKRKRRLAMLTIDRR